MKGIIIILTMYLFLNGNQDQGYRHIENTSFNTGEEISFRIHYGMINAGIATMKIDENIYYRNERPCFKIDVNGRSTGFFNLVLPINDVWGTYLDTLAMLPQMGYRYIEENRYRKYEEFVFNQLTDTVAIYDLNKHTRKLDTITYMKTPDNVQDMVSGYYFFRTIDFDSMKPGTIFNIQGFLEKEIYDLQVRYVGKEMVKTKIGKKRAIVISPIMPENSLFDGENSIKAWFSDDEKKIPLKIKASMFVGAVEVDIESYKPS